jgi:hypothetical protein
MLILLARAADAKKTPRTIAMTKTKPFFRVIADLLLDEWDEKNRTTLSGNPALP